MSEKKRGRPKSGYEVRDAEVTCSLTVDDAAWLATLATDLGFRDRGELLTAMLERLRLGGFAPIAFLKLGFQIQRLAEQAGTTKGAGFFNPLQPWPPLLTKPIPAVAVEEELPARAKKILQQVANLNA